MAPVNQLQRSSRLLVIGIAALMLVALGLVLMTDESASDRTVTAYFPRAVSLFEGSEVRILGVRVGTVTSVVPDGETVRVEMTYDAQYDLPDDVRAAIITPTLTADRFVQLTPAYESGPTLEDGGQIEVERTGVPIELDRIYRSLTDLTDALGPRGANKDGALNRLLVAGDELLSGQGAKANQTIKNLALTMETLGDGSEDLFATVESLNRFTTTLARNDATVARFMSNLGLVSQELASEDEQLVATLGALAGVLDDVDHFVRDNRALLVGNVRRIGRVAGILADYRNVIEEVVAMAPLAMGNLTNASDPRAGVTNSRMLGLESFQDVDGILCTMIRNGGVTDADTACQLLEALLEPVLGPVFDPRQTASPTPAAATTDGDYADTLDELLGGGE